MGNSPTPPGLKEQIMQMVDRQIAAFARSGFLRNATISDGGLAIKGQGGLTVEDGGGITIADGGGVTVEGGGGITILGGLLRLVFGAFNLFYVGPISPSLPDGTPQQGFRLRRADGTVALQTRDAFPGEDGTLNQALTWLDRGGNAVFADDTDSGQGIARPYLPLVFYRARNNDWPTVTSTSFETVYRAKAAKQQPRIYVRVWAIATVAGSTGELRLMVGPTQIDTTKTVPSGVVTEFVFGPLPVDGTHMSAIAVDVEARLASGSGGVQVGMSQGQGQQS